MTPSQRIQIDQLVAALWNGELSEKEFGALALEAGASLTAINSVLEEIRAEDEVS